MVLNEKEFTLILPKFDNEGNPISDSVLQDVAEKISKRFGGVTVIPDVLGCWHNDKTNELQCENNARILVGRDCESKITKYLMKKENKTCDEIMEDDSVFMKNLAREVGVELGQSGIFLTEDIANISEIKGKWSPEVIPQLRRRWKSDEINWFSRKL